MVERNQSGGKKNPQHLLYRPTLMKTWTLFNHFQGRSETVANSPESRGTSGRAVAPAAVLQVTSLRAPSYFHYMLQLSCRPLSPPSSSVSWFTGLCHAPQLLWPFYKYFQKKKKKNDPQPELWCAYVSHLNASPLTPLFCAQKYWWILKIAWGERLDLLCVTQVIIQMSVFKHDALGCNQKFDLLAVCRLLKKKRKLNEISHEFTQKLATQQCTMTEM